VQRRAFLQSLLAASFAARFPIAAFAADSDDTNDAPQRTTKAGMIRGHRSADGVVYSFKGVPFAQPPVGPLRFRAPQPPLPWTDVREADRFGLAPMQSGKPADQMSEDCLYLNVWTPTAPGPHPVFVWIHGGGNAGGWSGDSLADGSVFARAGIVCVTLGYRLGAFGFLELGELLGPNYAGSGNNGLRDLAAGLRWVHENITAFGGDPAHVTLAGESAGAKDVAGLLAMPEVKGLVRQAILESGSGQTVHTLESAHDVAHRLRTAADIDSAARLKDLPAADILAAQSRMSADYPHAFPFRPVVDGHILPKRPVDAVAAGSARNVSLIIGTNRDESLLFFSRDDASNPIGGRELTNLSLDRMTSQTARYQQTFPAQSDLDRRIHQLTAEEYWIPSVRLAEAQARAGGMVRMYRFDRTAHSGNHAGYAVHASELGYVWHDPAGATDPAEHALAALMHGAWIAFIATGNPQGLGLPDWPRYDTRARRTLLFNDDGTAVIAEDPNGAERTLWDGVL